MKTSLIPSYRSLAFRRMMHISSAVPVFYAEKHSTFCIDWGNISLSESANRRMHYLRRINGFV